MDSKDHWDEVYQTKGGNGVSWSQQKAEPSLRLIAGASGPDSTIIDVGRGASTLVDSLLEAGYREVTVLDWSRAALDLSRERLGILGAEVKWWEGDVLTAQLPLRAYDVWHDRAVFQLPDNFGRSASLRRAGKAVSQARRSRPCRYLRPGWPGTLQWTAGREVQCRCATR